jgi:ketosteroid isomerase-like protein
MLLAVFFAPQIVQAQDTCCFNNFRFAGGCQVHPAKGETCTSVLSYLNSFDSVGAYYCGNTTVRGGWTLISCKESGITPGGATVQESQPTYRAVQPGTSPRAVEPKTAPGAADASLIQTAAPMKVRFDDSVDSGADGAGHIVFGHLEEDLMSGDTVIAPAGSEVQAELVPTSFWTDGGGDAFEIQATSVKVGDQLVPLSGIAIQAEGQIPTSGEQLQVPEGSLVSFETSVAKEHQADKAILEKATARWMESFNTGNAEALAALYAEDAVVAPPNAPAIFGRDAIRADHQEQFATVGIAIELEDLEFVIKGDLGYKAGRYRVRTEDDTLIDRGKYLEVWRKIDGTWLIHRDIYNSSLPLPKGDEKED